MSPRTSRPKQGATKRDGLEPAERDFVEVIRTLASPDMEKNFVNDLLQLGWKWDEGGKTYLKGKVRLDSPEGADHDPVAFALRDVWDNCRHLFALLQNATPDTRHAAALAFNIGSAITGAHRRILADWRKGRPEDDEEKVFAEFDKAEASFKAAKNTGDKKFLFEDAKEHWGGGQELPITRQKFTAWRKWKKARAGGIRQK